MLAGISPGDDAMFAAAVVLCLVMTILGSVLPVLQAVHVDPIAVIRSQ